MRLFQKFFICLCFYISLNIVVNAGDKEKILDPNKLKKLNSDLDGFLKKRDNTKLPARNSQPHNKAARASNFRSTSDDARLISDIFEFVNSNVNNDTVSTSNVMKRSITTITTATTSTLDPKYCPYQNQTITCNATANLYRSYDGTCNNLNTPLLGAVNTPYIRYYYMKLFDLN